MGTAEVSATAASPGAAMGATGLGLALMVPNGVALCGVVLLLRQHGSTSH